VLRGVDQVRVRCGSAPEVSYVHDGKEHSVRARLVVGADGRQSTVRKQLGLQLTETFARTNAAGLLVEGFDGYPSDCMSAGTSGDSFYIVTPRAGGVARLYLLWDVANRARFAGADGTRRFLEAYGKYRFPFAEQVMAAKPAGPCATYPMNDSYMEEPCVEGGVLIGDAAGWNDPIIGQGLSIALRDARMVSELLLGERGAWSKATFTPYASERKERMRRLRICAQVATDMRCTFTPAGATRRAAWFDTLRSDPLVQVTGVTPLLGPDAMPAEGFEPAVIERVLALGQAS
jgi:2-polyprenyl-6-methoxyphenol hydroxylase-like FAD-dependent oxidoreductase